MANFSWTCPYCNRATTITDADLSENQHRIFLKTTPYPLVLFTTMILCPNPECHHHKITADLFKIRYTGSAMTKIGLLKHWDLLPLSGAKPVPEYIPEPIRKDYEEACLILELSPKASATLSRRCLQGMIRDFHGVSKGKLIDEINGIKEKTEPSIWKAIDAVRSIGNIGAHMEKDINLIIDVEPDEAKLLIGLIEMLFKDWYINREERKTLLEGIAKVAGIKDSQKEK